MMATREKHCWISSQECHHQHLTYLLSCFDQHCRQQQQQHHYHHHAAGDRLTETSIYYWRSMLRQKGRFFHGLCDMAAVVVVEADSPPPWGLLSGSSAYRTVRSRGPPIVVAPPTTFLYILWYLFLHKLLRVVQNMVGKR